MPPGNSHSVISSKGKTFPEVPKVQQCYAFIWYHWMRMVVNCKLVHSMATANLKKSEDFVTNITAATKYIPRRPRISINWNPPFQTQIYLVNSKKYIIFQKFLNRSKFFFGFTIHKKLNKSCSLEFFFCSWKKNCLSEKTLKENFC